MRVVLPAPFSPTTAWTRPGRNSSETPSSAVTRSYRFTIPCIETAGATVLVAPAERAVREVADRLLHADIGPLHHRLDDMVGVDRALVGVDAGREEVSLRRCLE